jgi:hypothetical protein
MPIIRKKDQSIQVILRQCQVDSRGSEYPYCHSVWNHGHAEAAQAYSGSLRLTGPLCRDHPRFIWPGYENCRKTIWEQMAMVGALVREGEKPQIPPIHRLVLKEQSPMTSFVQVRACALQTQNVDKGLDRYFRHFKRAGYDLRRKRRQWGLNK